MTYLTMVSCAVLAAGCNDDGVDSDEEARRAYLGLDDSIAKSITLGFQGFNLASSANIEPQTTNAIVAGSLTVSGQVDQGSSDNKGMRLYVGMVGYDDGNIVVNEDGDTIHVVYDTASEAANQPYLAMQLKSIPTGTLEGSLTSNQSMTGLYHLSGDIEGTLALNLTIAGTLMAGPNDTVVRVPGGTTVTGTATNQDGGVYNISLTL